ncbi:MAG: protein-L-isoaspartate(D-aspartate) O-methyltransferase [Alphaproteobacteria bacterium]|nr:protein-L-isoaspartate(D-aspartate) O-methyltransferase [Alphaproteobacteria bacterium]
MDELSELRDRLVSQQVEARGVRDPLVLAAMRTVPREKFVPDDLKEKAYEDSPLPIGARQTISQPYIVAFMVEALALEGGEKVLEIGAGSGYAAAVLSEIASEVFTIERIGQLAEKAAANLAAAGVANVHVRHADGTEGWAEEAPFDAILVSAGAPDVPKSLMRQLRIGGHMVVPVGSDLRAQELVRITRVDDSEFEREDLADVRFVPLIGKEGFEAEEEWEARSPRVVQSRPAVSVSLPSLIAKHGETFVKHRDADLDALLDRIGGARVVLIGEASHGTSEFYAMRAHITQELIERKRFNIVAVEADWPDAARIDHYVRHRGVPPSEWTAFARFPTWMWRNEETRAFVDWLHNRNATRASDRRAAFYGLDLYSLYTSVRAVIDYLETVDPDLAAVARQRYGCLTPWEADPAAYGRAALRGDYRKCERDVAHMLVELLRKRQEYTPKDGERFLDATQNAQLVANAEQYYRVMYYGSRASWNLRDSHMFDTLQNVLAFHGPQSKAVVWAHNSHIGDAAATEMGRRREHNIGQLCRQHFGGSSYHIGFGTNAGTVAAASFWDGPMEVMKVKPAHAQSYERLFHMTNAPGLLLPLRGKQGEELHDKLARPRLERAIGVIYRPDSELASHYFEAVLPRQFDEYIWIDQTCAIKPFAVAELQGLPDMYPFGL